MSNVVVPVRPSRVAGVDAPAFVERHAPAYRRDCRVMYVSPGLMPRPSLSVLASIKVYGDRTSLACRRG